MTETPFENIVLQELKKISKILTLTNAAAVKAELDKIVNSDDRRKIWVLMDGKRNTADFIKETGLSQQGVNKFMNAAKAADLIDYVQRQPPRRKLDYIPPEWVGLVELPKDEEAENGEKKTEGETNG